MMANERTNEERTNELMHAREREMKEKKKEDGMMIECVRE